MITGSSCSDDLSSEDICKSGISFSVVAASNNNNHPISPNSPSSPNQLSSSNGPFFSTTSPSVLLKVANSSDVKLVAGSIAHNCRNHVDENESVTLFASGQGSVNRAIKSIAIARSYLQQNQIELYVKPEFRNEKTLAVSLKVSPGSTHRYLSSEPASQSVSHSGKNESKELSLSRSSSSSFSSLHDLDLDRMELNECAEQKEKIEVAKSSSLSASNIRSAKEVEVRVAHDSNASLVAGSIAQKLRLFCSNDGQSVESESSPNLLFLSCMGQEALSVAVAAITIASKYLMKDRLCVQFQPQFFNVTHESGQSKSAIRLDLFCSKLQS